MIETKLKEEETLGHVANLLELETSFETLVGD